MFTKIVIVEDEMHTANMLRDMLLELRPDFEVISILQSVEDTVAWLKSNAEQRVILFLDIELADGNCFAIFDQVKVEHPVIFTTAYNEFALKAFELNSVDYLLKPLKQADLTKAIDKLEKAIALFDRSRERTEEHQGIDYQHLARTIMASSENYRKRFLVAKRDTFIKLTVEEVAYFYFESRVTFAVTFDGKQHILNQPLDRLEEELDPQRFFRTNRQTIVNIDAVDHLETYFSGKLVVQLVNKLSEKIMVSRGKATPFKDWVNQ